MIPSGKGMWVWNVPAVEADPVKFADLMSKAGVKVVYIKAAEGPNIFCQNKNGVFATWGENLKQELVDALHAKGILVYGWGFCYGTDYKGEGVISGNQVVRFGLDGWIFDVESNSDSKQAANSNGVHTCIQFRAISDKPIYLCWWARYKNPDTGGQWHPDHMTAKQFIQSSWDKYVIGYMPMVYWYTTPTDQYGLAWAVKMIEQSMSQYREITDKEIIPAGRAYTGDNGVAYPDAMKLFAKRAEELGCPGVSWWSAEHALKLVGVWEAITEIFGGEEESGTVEEEVNPKVVVGNQLSELGVMLTDAQTKLIEVIKGVGDL
jgi:hypothetical protein